MKRRKRRDPAEKKFHAVMRRLRLKILRGPIDPITREVLDLDHMLAAERSARARDRQLARVLTPNGRRRD